MCNKIDAFDNSQLINKKVATLIYCYVRAERYLRVIIRFFTNFA